MRAAPNSHASRFGFGFGFGAANPNPTLTLTRCGLLLVSGDGDYAHMLSRLRQVGVTTTVVHDARNSSRQLLEVCDRAATAP